ncbi:WD repeat-containing protein 33 [Chamberlinius hualienensis]
MAAPAAAPAVTQSPQKSFPNSRPQGPYQKTNAFYPTAPFKQNVNPVAGGVEFDGKRLRKAVVRKTIDYNSAIVRCIKLRTWQRDFRDYRAIQPDTAYYTEMTPPPYYVHNAINAVTTKFVRTSTNKMRCPIFCVVWTPEGRRLVTGASSGEFTLWNGLTFNFETILQAHDSPVRKMCWSNNDHWMVTADHAGFVKYWQSNMNNVKMFQAHKEPVRGISFCPTDQKFATCSDDGTVRIWDFLHCYEERILRGHGADVKSVSWHPHKSLLVSGSKDSQQPIKFWDPKTGQSIATLHAHKSTVMEVKWNSNGNWLLTGSRDHLIKLFDIRKLNQEVRTFRGHKKEVTSLAWHPVHETLFASGGSDGAVMFWLSGIDKEVGCMEQAHDSIVWALDWHPLGHILCSGSNDHTCKFWTRNRPGDKMRDKYNLNILPGGKDEEAAEYDDVVTVPSIPGMGLEHVQSLNSKSMEQLEVEAEVQNIPGLDFGNEEPPSANDKTPVIKKMPYAKPISKQFQQHWMETKRPLLVSPSSNNNNNNNNRLSPPPPDIPRGPPSVPANYPPRMMGTSDQHGPPPPPQRPPPPSSVQQQQWRPSHPFPSYPDGSTSSDGGPGSPPRSNFPGSQGGGYQPYHDKEKNWKEFGDSDFRRPMDSDFRVQSAANRSDDGHFTPDNGHNDSHEHSDGDRNDEKDQDLRFSHLRDKSDEMEHRQPSSMDNSSSNRDGNESGNGSRSKGSRSHSRWDPPANREMVISSSGAHFNNSNYGGSNDQGPPHSSGGPHGPNSGPPGPRMFPRDWDERLGPPMDGPIFRKRKWNEGQGGNDGYDQRNMNLPPGGGGFNRQGNYYPPQQPPPHNLPPHNMGPGPGGRFGGPNRWGGPWGPNRGMMPPSDLRPLPPPMRGRAPPGHGPGPPNMRGGYGWGY